ncbi:hypothetical protein EDD16DRAFT_1700542 [Pisolithus croceorrhizus]|nr:hypothetical protein EDD16DRAFT_1700542 [Pisolithus croceorrhizus]
MSDPANIPPTTGNQTPHPDEPNMWDHYNGIGNSQSTLNGAVPNENQPDVVEDAPFPNSLLCAREIPGLLTRGNSIER